MAQITLNSTGVASSGSLVLQSNGTTTAVTIDASQNVGVGAAAATSNFSGSSTVLSVKGNGTNKIGSVIAQSFGTTNATNIEMFAADGTDVVGLLTKGASTAMTFYTGTSPSERARFNSTGALVFAGGTTTANGIGITFPATQSASTDANTLDDYEEGTYTPTPTNITVVSGTPVYTGKYTKIGNIVQVFFEMSGGNITVTGGSSNLSLPFTAPTVDGTGGYTNGATGAFVGGVLAYGTVMILTTGVTSTSLTGSLVYRVA